MLKKNYILLALVLACLVAMMINSCKKDSRTDQQQSTITDPAIAQAKGWYERTYAANSNTSGQQTNAATDKIDYSHFIKPDWQHSSNYTRFNKKVIEIPLDPSSSKLSTALNNFAGGNPVYKKEYSRSSFLLLNDGTGYQAYVMTIIADSSYIKKRPE